MDANNQVNQGNGDQGSQNQQQAPGWISGLPDEYKTNETLTQFKTVGDFAKYHFDETGKTTTKVTELEGKLAQAIFKPGESATDDEKAAYLKAIGRPDKMEEYDFGKDADKLPLTGWYREMAHSLGLTQEQAKGIFDRYQSMAVENAAKQEETRNNALAAGMEAIKKEWGADFEKNAAIIKAVQETVAGDEEAKNWITAHNAENDPFLSRLFLKIAPAFLDDKTIQGGMRTQKPPIGMNYTTMEQFRQGG